MRLAVVVSTLLGCGSPTSSSTTPTAPVPEDTKPTVTNSDATKPARPASADDPLTFCTLVLTTMDEIAKCRGEGWGPLRDSFAAIKPPMEPAAALQGGARCASFVEGLLTDPEYKCPMSGAGRRAEVGAFLDWYWADRVKLEPTGHAEADVILTKLASDRDAICACADKACAYPLVAAQMKSGKPLPGDAPAKASALLDALIEDIKKCSNPDRWDRPK